MIDKESCWEPPLSSASDLGEEQIGLETSDGFFVHDDPVNMHLVAFAKFHGVCWATSWNFWGSSYFAEGAGIFEIRHSFGEPFDVAELCCFPHVVHILMPCFDAKIHG